MAVAGGKPFLARDDCEPPSACGRGGATVRSVAEIVKTSLSGVGWSQAPSGQAF